MSAPCPLASQLVDVELTTKSLLPGHDRIQRFAGGFALCDRLLVSCIDLDLELRMLHFIEHAKQIESTENPAGLTEVAPAELGRVLPSQILDGGIQLPEHVVFRKGLRLGFSHAGRLFLELDVAGTGNGVIANWWIPANNDVTGSRNTGSDRLTHMSVDIPRTGHRQRGGHGHKLAGVNVARSSHLGFQVLDLSEGRDISRTLDTKVQGGLLQAIQRNVTAAFDPDAWRLW